MTISTEELRILLGEATPGPWTATSEDNGEWGIDSKAWGIAVVAAAAGLEDPNGRSDANAALIAMAPDLAAELLTARAKLEAAERLAAALELVSKRCGPRATDGHVAAAALTAWENAK